MPSLSATAEGAAALNLAPVGNEGKGEVERLPLVQNAALNLDLVTDHLPPRWFGDLIQEKIIRTHKH